VRKIELVVEKIYPDPKDNREDGDDARERQKPVRPTIESIKIVESDKIGIVFILLGPFVLILEMLEIVFSLKRFSAWSKCSCKTLTPWCVLLDTSFRASFWASVGFSQRDRLVHWGYPDNTSTSNVKVPSKTAQTCDSLMTMSNLWHLR
jgi:hypothetical protein